jgi:hypothetical protein
MGGWCEEVPHTARLAATDRQGLQLVLLNLQFVVFAFASPQAQQPAHQLTADTSELTAATAAVQATRAYLHAEADVEASLQKAGFKVVKREMTATKFYFSRLLEAVKA